MQSSSWFLSILIFFFFTTSFSHWPSSPLIYDRLSPKDLKGEEKNKRERRTRSKCKCGEPGEGQEMYLFPREHATPHGSLQIIEPSAHTHRIPGDLTRTRDTCTCFFAHLYPQHLKILISKGVWPWKWILSLLLSVSELPKLGWLVAPTSGSPLEAGEGHSCLSLLPVCWRRAWFHR